MIREEKVKTVVSLMTRGTKAKLEVVARRERMLMTSALSVVFWVIVPMIAQRGIDALDVGSLDTKSKHVRKRLLVSIVVKKVTRVRSVRSQRKRPERCLL
jgi:hypothetical protein